MCCVVSGYIRGVDVGYLVLLYVMMHVIRTLTIALLAPLVRRIHMSDLSLQDCALMSYGGLRGSMSLLLGLIVYVDPTLALSPIDRARIMFLVGGLVSLLLVVNGSMMQQVVRWLGLDENSPESQLMLQTAFRHLKHNTALQVALTQHTHSITCRSHVSEQMVRCFRCAHRVCCMNMHECCDVSSNPCNRSMSIVW